jgi:acyl-CoA oxidase
LIPYIAAGYVICNFYNSFFKDYINFFIGVSYGGSSPEQPEMGAEIHCLSSVGKAMSGWIARDCIQESREACGGHGYLKAARLGSLRNDHDANNTYEGDNNVLLQQTANYLLKRMKEKREEGTPVRSPSGSVDFMDDIDTILTLKGVSDIESIESLLRAYRFLVCWLLTKSEEKLTKMMKKHGDNLFIARSQSQVYYMRSLSIAFFECDCTARFDTFIRNEAPDDLKPVLSKMCLLFGQWSIEKHLSTLFEAKYFHESYAAATAVREKVLDLCGQLKDDAVALVDVFAPPDFILNSCLGASDGRVYEHIFDALTHNQGAFDRPSWIKEFTEDKPILRDPDSDVMVAKL